MFAAGGVSGKYTDRPTISYSPTTGEMFARSFMAPAPLEALLFVIQGGVRADFLLGLTVQSIGGHHNQGLIAGDYQTADPKLNRLLQLLRVLQRPKGRRKSVSCFDHSHQMIRLNDN